MLSRVADSLYWMSRYLERAEHTSRLLDVQINLSIERVGDLDGRWQRVISALGIQPSAGADPRPEGLMFDATNRSSILHCIFLARENARQIREQISSEMWLNLNRLYHDVREASNPAHRGDRALSFVRLVRERCHLLRGLTDATISHTDGWRFLQIGQFLERGVLVSALLDSYFTEFEPAGLQMEEVGEYLEWVGLLRSCAAFEAFLRYCPLGLRPDKIAEYLILDPHFPHSIHFSVTRVADCLAEISKGARLHRTDEMNRRIGRLQSALAYVEIDEILQSGLHGFLSQVRDRGFQVHDALYTTYLTYPIESAIEA